MPIRDASDKITCFKHLGKEEDIDAQALGLTWAAGHFKLTEQKKSDAEIARDEMHAMTGVRLPTK